MADRTVRVRVVADTAGFAGAMRGAAADAERLGASATGAARGVRGMTDEAAAARGGLVGIGEGARGARGALANAGTAAGSAARGLRGITTEGSSTVGALGRVGKASRDAFNSIANGAKHAAGMAAELSVLLAGGEIVRGLGEIVSEGNDYSNSLNKFQEVTRASGLQMNSAAREAQALGADLRLPEANASEAADAMVELAKAGLSAGDAITATRGTIQLASAARTDVATAARIEGDALDQFGLKASDATMVADTLANVANNTSGELTDLAYALKYVGPVAHGMGIDVQQVATAVGLLGKSGIIGETAGTALRSMLVNLSKPTAAMKGALKDLGIQAYDSQGNFKGLEYVVSGLSAAQKRMTTQQFTAAAALAFGKPALSAVVALAHQGTQNFDQMATAVGRQGGAAALAAAESKGLGGAMKSLGKELSSTFLQLYIGVSPALEKVARGMSTGVADALPYIKRGIRDATDLWDIYGPAVESKLSHATAGIGREAAGFVQPAEHAIEGLTADALPLAVTGLEELDKTFHNAAAGAEPLVAGLKKVATSVASGTGALGVLDGRIQTGMQAVGESTSVLQPIGTALGGVARGFAALPGPIQLSVISMLALRPFRSQIQGMQQSVIGYGRSAVQSFQSVRGSIQTQNILAEQAGVTLGRFGGTLAALEARSPGLRAMGDAFRGATSSIPEDATAIQRFSGTLRGVSAAGAVGAMNGLKMAGRGVLGVLGGPWGLAMTAGFTALDYFAQKSAAARQAVADFTNALQQDSGAIGQNSLALVAQKLQTAGVLDTATKYGVAQNLVTQAALGNKAALAEVTKELQANGASYKFGGRELQNTADYMSHLQTRYNVDAQKLLDTIGDTSSAVGNASQAYKNQQNAIKGVDGATVDATNPTTMLNNAIKTLGDSASDADTKTQALQQALQLLNGGSLDVTAAVANQTQVIQQLADSYKSGVDHSKGWGQALLEADGSLNATTANGAALNQSLTSIGQTAAATAEATYTYASANGSVTDALGQSEKAMERSYQAAVMAGRKYGLTAAEAQNMAAQMGLIPSSLAITLSTPGLDATQKGLLYVQGLAGHLPQGKSIKVSALSADAVKDLTAVGVKIETLPGGRQMVITAPTAQAQAALNALIAKKIPGKSVAVDANTAQARSELQAVETKVSTLKGKTITVGALNSDAIKALEAVGFQVQKLPNKQVKITVPVGGPLSSVNSVQRAINGLHGKSVTNTVTTKNVTVGSAVPGGGGRRYLQADGGIMRFYADGGMEHHVAQIAPAGAMRLWAEPETGGEAYIPLAPGKRSRSLAILDQVAKQFGYGLEKYASGGLRGVRAFADGGFSYAPADPTSTFGAGAGMDRYNAAVSKVDAAGKTLTSALAAAAKAALATRDAERNLSKVRSEHHTAAQLAAAEEKLTKARQAESAADKKVAADRKALNSADTALGVKAGTRSVASFNLGAYEKQLAAANKANAQWEANLDNIGKRAGSDVEDTLRGMGQDGEALVAALAKASGKTFSQIVAQLKALAPTAQATLKDYTKQMTDATAASSTFQQNLLKLSAMGDTALANQLAAQGDDAAAAIAAQAVASPGNAAKANAAAQVNANLLTGDDLTNAMTILSVLQAKPGQGLAQLVAAGLDVPTIEALLPKIMKQIQALPPADSRVLLQQWSQIQSGKGLSFARGGIAADGAGLIHWAERGTGGEAFIPLAMSNRARSTGILSAVAGMFGYQLTPVASRPGGGGAGGATHITKHNEVHLHGARQTSAEQAADIVRRLAFVG